MTKTSARIPIYKKPFFDEGFFYFNFNSAGGIKLTSVEKTFVKSYLKKFDAVPYKITFDDSETAVIGKGQPQFSVKLNHNIKKSALLESTSLALGEAYMDKTLEIDGDLYNALNCFLSQINMFTIDSHSLKSILHTPISKRHQKKDIHSHYDIGNDFYSMWLDETLSYSCAYFKNENDTLKQAQYNKVEHILAKLNLKEGMKLLDIGCGWGFLLIQAAKKYKIKGIGITLSEEQAKKFEQRIKEENLQNYLEVKLMDYRDLEKSGLSFDRVVSVGMLEHVGREHYELYMKNVKAVLKDKGLFLLHYISGLKESDGDPWIKKYIFPGGVIPSLREIISICANYNFYTLDIESIRRHYTKTLLHWNKNFQEHKKEIEKKFDENFVRMWELYLCSCAAAFNNGTVDVHQILISSGVNNDIPMTREYMD